MYRFCREYPVMVMNKTSIVLVCLMILLNKRKFTNIMYEVYNLIKTPLGIIYHKYINKGEGGYVTRLFMSTNTQFQYKQTLLYNVDHTLYLLLRLGNKQTFSFKNCKLLRVCNACCFCVFFYIHHLNGGRNNYVT